MTHMSVSIILNFTDLEKIPCVLSFVLLVMTSLQLCCQIEILHRQTCNYTQTFSFKEGGRFHRLSCG